MPTDPAGGRNAVREGIMQRLRAGIRERQRRGDSLQTMQAWINHQQACGAITEVEAAIAGLIMRHYAEPALWPTRGPNGL